MPYANDEAFDLVIVGAGAAGLATAIFAAQAPRRILLVDRAETVGGALHLAQGQLSAAGSRLQQEKGVEDRPDLHFDEVVRLSKGRCDRDLVRLAVDHAAGTVDWLMAQGFTPLPNHPVTGSGHEHYLRARYSWAEGGGRAILDAMTPLLDKAARSGRLQLRLGCDALGLDLDEAGCVAAIRLRDGGPVRTVRAGAVVLATGGYNADPTFYQEVCGRPLYAALSYAHALGGGHRLAMAAGGYLRGAENFFCNFGYLLAGEALPARLAARVVTYPERRPPWEIYVNARAERFVREDEPSIDARENALLRQPDERYWIVFDHAILQAAPPLLDGWSREAIAAAFAEGRPFFHQADTLEGLARKAGLPPAALVRTVTAYNHDLPTEHDAFRRLHRPAPIGSTPFFALRMQGATVTSAAGVAVDEGLRVRRLDGSAIPNLYAAGEILGAGQLMGPATCGGMMVTPALTFGRLLGAAFAGAPSPLKPASLSA